MIYFALLKQFSALNGLIWDTETWSMVHLWPVSWGMLASIKVIFSFIVLCFKFFSFENLVALPLIRREISFLIGIAPLFSLSWLHTQEALPCQVVIFGMALRNILQFFCEDYGNIWKVCFHILLSSFTKVSIRRVRVTLDCLSSPILHSSDCYSTRNVDLSIISTMLVVFLIL